jgi:C4-dicarboxylate-specific signal transduction histidine kinase
MVFDAAKTAPTLVEPTLETVASEYRDRADVTVECACPPEMAIEAGERLEDVLDDLVDSALVENTADPEVTLAAEPSNGVVELRVASPGGHITENAPGSRVELHFLRVDA